tara:strand:+ start:168 stop:272 length:105 start_codon:yes stop_codon:yes gene_type:complete
MSLLIRVIKDSKIKRGVALIFSMILIFQSINKKV